MNQIPNDNTLESSVQLLLEGFTFSRKRFEKLQTDIFQTRLMFENVICMYGEDASRIFYNTELFQRKGAAPKSVQKTLIGEGGVQGLDNSEHRKRKAMFMSLMGQKSIERLLDIMAEQWHEQIGKWEKKESVKLFDETQAMLCEAVCKWAGVPLQDSEAKIRGRELGYMIDGFGSVGPRAFRGMMARKRVEEWMEGIIHQIRKKRLKTDTNSAAYATAFYRGIDGKLVDVNIAAVELINILRPTVAIATYITFAADALNRRKEYVEKIRKDKTGQMLDWFAQEVRRFYPFGPFTGARVKKDFSWRGYAFKQGTLVLLDIFNTNRDPRQWDNPDAFRPERFENWNGSAHNFIPQGGGDHYRGHRCAGEWITIELLKQAIAFLVKGMDYTVPKQDLRIDLTRIPTLPNSRLIIANVRSKGSHERVEEEVRGNLIHY
jgi:fatty-acid peroxygenase